MKDERTYKIIGAAIEAGGPYVERRGSNSQMGYHVDEFSVKSLVTIL